MNKFTVLLCSKVWVFPFVLYQYEVESETSEDAVNTALGYYVPGEKVAMAVEGWKA